jgi:hypothetical protein
MFPRSDGLGFANAAAVAVGQARAVPPPTLPSPRLPGRVDYLLPKGSGGQGRRLSGEHTRMATRARCTGSSTGFSGPIPGEGHLRRGVPARPDRGDAPAERQSARESPAEVAPLRLTDSPQSGLCPDDNGNLLRRLRQTEAPEPPSAKNLCFTALPAGRRQHIGQASCRSRPAKCKRPPPGTGSGRN